MATRLKNRRKRREGAYQRLEANIASHLRTKHPDSAKVERLLEDRSNLQRKLGY